MRPDAGMSLLNDLTSEAMKPEYLTTKSPRRSRWAMPLALLMAVALLTLFMVSTTRSRNKVTDERKGPLSRVAAEQQHHDELTARVSELGAESGQLRRDAVVDPSVRASLQETELAAGTIAVSGPSLRIRVNDVERTGNGSRVTYDSNPSCLMNGLWRAGTEAVAVNGHRITTFIPIRSTGSIITMDYVSLNPPYVIEAIGDPSRLQAHFARTFLAAWQQYPHNNCGIAYGLQTVSNDLELPTGPAMTLRYAKS